MTELMTPDELAAFLRKTEGALRTQRHRGQGPPAYRVGREIRYRRDEVEQWLAEQRIDQRAVEEIVP